MDCTLDTSLAMLARTPGVLRAMLMGVDEHWTEPNYGPGTWSAREVVAHLIHADRTDWLPRMRVIIEHGETRPFEPFDRAGHAPLLSAHTLAELVGLFERERTENLARVRAMGLTNADLARRGRHPALGGVTLGNLLATWVVHDLNHVAQIAKAMAYQYKSQVGAWEEYLSILAPPSPR
jgi:hypothetical protein